MFAVSDAVILADKAADVDLAQRGGVLYMESVSAIVLQSSIVGQDGLQQ
jgi:hypothetical protein